MQKIKEKTSKPYISRYWSCHPIRHGSWEQDSSHGQICRRKYNTNNHRIKTGSLTKSKYHCRFRETGVSPQSIQYRVTRINTDIN